MVGVNMRSQARASSPRPPTPTPRRRRPLTPQLIWQDTSCVGVLPDELLRSPGVPCSSGRAVVGTTPGMMRVRTAPYVARAHASRPPQSRHISCAAKPPNHETLPPTAAGKLPRWLRTICSLAPHLCGFTAARHADVCAQLLRRARTHLRV